MLSRRDSAQSVAGGVQGESSSQSKTTGAEVGQTASPKPSGAAGSRPGGVMKIVYDLSLLFSFRHIKPPEEKAAP